MHEKVFGHRAFSATKKDLGKPRTQFVFSLDSQAFLGAECGNRRMWWKEDWMKLKSRLKSWLCRVPAVLSGKCHCFCQGHSLLMWKMVLLIVPISQSSRALNEIIHINKRSNSCDSSANVRFCLMVAPRRLRKTMRASFILVLIHHLYMWKWSFNEPWVIWRAKSLSQIVKSKQIRDILHVRFFHGSGGVEH